MYFGDTESTNANPTRLWLWGIKKADKNVKYIGYNADSLVDRLFKLGRNETKSKKTIPKVYFFNAKWDFSFICDFMLKNGFGCYKENEGEKGYFEPLTNKMGVMYNVTIYFKNEKKYRLIKIVEAYNLIGNSIGEWGKKLGIPKGETPIYEKKPTKIKLDDINYMWRDIEILEKAFLSYRNNGMLKDTVASNALYNFKNILNGKTKGMEDKFRSLFPVLTNDFNTGYRGGWIFVSPLYKRKEMYKLFYYDVKSMYPDKLKNKRMPFGIPNEHVGFIEPKKNKLYIYDVEINFTYKPYVIPFLRIKDTEPGVTKYPKKYEGELQLTCVELGDLKKHCKIEKLNFIKCYEFDSNNAIFACYIDFWFSEKSRCESIGDYIGVECAKKMLNALYGKMGTKKEVESMEYYLKDDKVALKEHSKEVTDGVYSPVALFTTSYARHQMLEACSLIGWENVVYGDTDSLFSIKPIIKNVGSSLGQWENKALSQYSVEYVEKAIFFETKQYAYFVKGISEIKASGLKKNKSELTDADKDGNKKGIDPFVFSKNTSYDEFKYLMENKKPIRVLKRRTVVGGSQLYRTEFTPKFNEKSITVEEYVR